LFCQRFIARGLASHGFAFCNPMHAERQFKRLTERGNLKAPLSMSGCQ
jgi:hypothetical protein